MIKSYEWLKNSNIKQQTRKDGNFTADICEYTFVWIECKHMTNWFMFRNNKKFGNKEILFE